MRIPEQLKNQFLSLYAIALADERNDEREMKFLLDLASAKGISKEDMEQILSHPLPEVMPTPKTLTMFEKIEYLHIAAGMILADGIVDKREKLLFANICQRMDFLDENIPDLMEFMLEKVKQGVSVEQVFKIVQYNSEL